MGLKLKKSGTFLFTGLKDGFRTTITLFKRGVESDMEEQSSPKQKKFFLITSPCRSVAPGGQNYEGRY